MQKIQMKLIFGSKPSPETMVEVLAANPSARDGASMQFQVYELSLPGKTIYASWSGGYTQPDGKPALTLIGQAAFESMLNLPFGDTKAIYFIEMRLGPTPLLQKLLAELEKVPDQGRVCFYGDLAGELDGQIANIFDPIGIRQVYH